MTEPLLRLRNIRAGYGRTQIVNDISLDIQQGERLALIGRNGMGKTTLLATIMGLTQLHSGKMEWCSQSILDMPTHRRAALGLGLVPQTRDIFKSLSVEENIIAGLRGDATLEEAYALFPRLKERRKNGGGQLSGGEQQMLSIARTLMGRPKLLMLDEPLEGLAPTICDMLMGVFEGLAKAGATTIILVEQHADLAVGFADRVVILDTGMIAYQGTTASIKADHTILDRLVGVGLAEV
ncbi:MAG: ABC transporter ATP-binding protein [Hyphomicrobiales bacterium]|nr:ABC transporter ATP-binding protein [Hyphomicrobiales bacterium]MDE2114680.1 ABC transporter ATP-binding protein [Hyphomicrobiales bacterium]